MAHGFLQSFDNKLDVFSAGTKPAEKVNPMAVKVMDEMSIDLAHHTPKKCKPIYRAGMGLCYYGLRWGKRKLPDVYG
jgi:protein-tyrosine-phosphatase